MGNSPLHYFFHCRVNFLVKSNIALEKMIVSKALTNSLDGGVSGSTVSKGSKSQSRINIFQREQIRTPSMMGEGQWPMEWTCLHVAG